MLIQCPSSAAIKEIAKGQQIPKCLPKTAQGKGIRLDSMRTILLWSWHDCRVEFRLGNQYCPLGGYWVPFTERRPNPIYPRVWCKIAISYLSSKTIMCIILFTCWNSHMYWVVCVWMLHVIFTRKWTYYIHVNVTFVRNLPSIILRLTESCYSLGRMIKNVI